MDDMVRGYIDGGEPDAIEPGPNQSASYRHGWLNGRDDRMRSPRAFAATLRAEAIKAREQDRTV